MVIQFVCGHRLLVIIFNVKLITAFINGRLSFQGALIEALKVGDWVLLDEINLAAAETLECLSGLLESSTGSIILMERG